MHKYFRIIAVALAIRTTTTGQNTGRITLIPNASDAATGEARFAELRANGTNYVGFKAPTAIGSNRIWTLPSADGSADQALVTNGSGVLSWSGALSGFWTRTGSRIYPSTIGDTVVLGTTATAGGGELYLYDESSGAGQKATTLKVRAGADQSSVDNLVSFLDSSGTVISGVNPSGDFYQAEGSNQTIGFNQYALSFASDRGFGWTSTSNYFDTSDTEIIRHSAGRVKVTKNNKTATGDLTAAAVSVEDNLTASGHILTTTTGTKDVGSSANYWQTLYVQNIDAAPSGVLSNYVKARKLEVADLNGGTTFWDVQSIANGTIASNFFVRDNAGNTILDLVRRVSSADVDEGRLRLHWVPSATDTYDLGVTARKWRDIRASGLIHADDGYRSSDGTHDRFYVNNPGAGSNTGTAIRIQDASGTNLFYTTYAGSVYAKNLTVDSCTGCGGGAVADGGATTYVTATGDNFAVGATSTSYKFEVAGGASRFGGSLEFATDNAYNVGASSARPATAYLRALNLAGDVTPNTDNSHALGSTSARFGAVYSGTAFRVHTSGVDRFEALNTGVNVRSSGGTLNFSVTASSGDIDTQGVYKKGGTSGITASGTTCTITAISGGIITGGSCS